MSAADYSGGVASTRRKSWAKDAAAIRYYRREAARRPGQRTEFTARAMTLEAGMAEAQVCRDCGAELRDPASVARGRGPDCWAKRVEAAKG